MKKELEGKANDLEVIQYIKDAAKSMVGIQPRPHFLLEFAPEGSHHDELVVDRNTEQNNDGVEDDITGVNQLPNKMNEFLKVRFPLNQKIISSKNHDKN